VYRTLLFSLIAITLIASTAAAAPRTVLYEHFTASW
jgi:hypothetical protein